MPPTRRNLSIAIPAGFAVALCVGAGANKMIALSSIPASATVDAGCSVGAGDQRQAGEQHGHAMDKAAHALPSYAVRSVFGNAGAVSPKTGSPDRLLSAIEWVESRRNPRAVGDGGRAVGILQIHRVMVDDCARLAPGEHFTYADRLDPERSRAMFRVYQQHYNPTGDIERGARIWCGGPDGWKQDSTLPYLARVRKAMEEQR